MPKKKTKKAAGAPRGLTFVAGRVPTAPTRDFTSVGMQQGRVPLDPDSNEQGAIDGRPPRIKKV
jgi:hypothetical protein